MSVIARINGTNATVIIPLTWCKNVCTSYSFNYGARRNNFTVFYSANKAATPDFKLEVRQVFDSSVNGCYRARILDVIANDLGEVDAEPVINEAEVKAQLEQKLVLIEAQRQQIQELNERVGVEDLTESDIEEFQIELEGNDDLDHLPMEMEPVEAENNRRSGANTPNEDLFAPGYHFHTDVSG